MDKRNLKTAQQSDCTMVITDHFQLGLETLAFQSMLYPDTVEVEINKLHCVMAASL